jgi:hypothetical protein
MRAIQRETERNSGLTFPLLDCSESGNFVITLINTIFAKCWMELFLFKCQRLWTHVLYNCPNHEIITLSAIIKWHHKSGISFRRKGLWLPQTEHTRGHVWHIYFVEVNQLMVSTVKLPKWWLQLGSSSYSVGTNERYILHLQVLLNWSLNQNKSNTTSVIIRTRTGYPSGSSVLNLFLPNLPY